RPGDDSLGAARPATDDPLGRAVGAGLLLRRGWRRGLPLARGAAPRRAPAPGRSLQLFKRNTGHGPRPCPTDPSCHGLATDARCSERGASRNDEPVSFGGEGATPTGVVAQIQPGRRLATNRRLV